MAMVITCCKDCVPPKRYPGCGAHCKEYKEQKKQLELKKEALRKSLKEDDIIPSDFNDISYVDYKKRKRRKRY